MKPIPVGKKIILSEFAAGAVLVNQTGKLGAVPANNPLAQGAAAQFTVVDRGLGRVALRQGDVFVSVASPENNGLVELRKGPPTDAETFQWTETPYGELVLLSLATHRHLRIAPAATTVFANHPGPEPDRKDGSCFLWKVVGRP